jgi:hypothetical protein
MKVRKTMRLIQTGFYSFLLGIAACLLYMAFAW